MHDSSIQVFSHIFKTAGSTLVQVMQRQFRPDEILSYEDEYWAVGIRDLPDRAATGLKGIRCVMGHIPFGLHEAVDREVKYVTMLRDPIELTLSWFSSLKERGGRRPDAARGPQRPVFADVPRMSLDEFVEFMERMGMANLQTRFVSGHLDLRNPMPPYERLPETALDLAKANLFATHTTFGLVEHFDLSLLLFKRRLGWRNIYYRSVRVTERRVTRTQVPARTLARIQELHGEDTRLYEMAMNAFWRALAQVGLDSPHVLYRFRAANRGYGLLRGGVGRLRRLAGRTLGAVGSPRADG